VYGPNTEALALLDRIAARVKAGAGENAVPFSFAAAGKPDPNLALSHVEALGFVPDLGAFLSKDAVLVAPILNGTGIKTKIIDALEYAVPVVTTPLGAEGLALQPGLHFHQAIDEDSFTAILLRLVQSADARRALETMARAAREAVLETHGRPFLLASLRRAAGGAAQRLPEN
jgi:glycosyltransferase involved in cell wall biosynthesis